MLANRDALTKGTKTLPRAEAAPAVESAEKVVVLDRRARLRVEEIEPRVAPNAIWGD
jgi:hypothetical protein